MRINGQSVEKLNEDILVLPRANCNIVFKGVAVADFTEFDEHCPVPVPPALMTKNGKVSDTKDVTYRQQLQNHALRRMSWMVLKTLEPSEVEWESVDMEKPSTWENWADDMAKILSPAEQQRLLNFVLAVNCLDEKKVEQARADFLRGLAQEASSE